MPSIEVCYSPALFPYITVQKPYIVVVVDILRATTSFCAAFQHGVKEIIPVATLEEAREYKRKGYLVAGERDGSTLPFADIGNSPASFMKGDFEGKTVVFTTTNGTVAMNLGVEAQEVVAGAFANLSTLASWLEMKGKEGNNLLILCAGWYNQFSLEDSVFAGCLAQRLIHTGVFSTGDDATNAAIDLWNTASPDLIDYIKKASHLNRLTALKVTNDLEYCFTLDTVQIIPILRDGRLAKKSNDQ